METSIAVGLGLDTSGFDRAMERVKSGLSGIKAGIQAVGKAGIKLNADGIVNGLKAAQASSLGLEKSMARVNTLFGIAAKSAQRLAAIDRINAQAAGGKAKTNPRLAAFDQINTLPSSKGRRGGADDGDDGGGECTCTCTCTCEGIELPEIKIPDIQLPEIKMPDIELPKIKISDVELPEIKLPEIELPEIQFPEPDTSGLQSIFDLLSALSDALQILETVTSTNGESIVVVIASIQTAFSAWNLQGLVVNIQVLVTAIGSLSVSLQMIAAWTATGQVLAAVVTSIGVAFSTWNVSQLLVSIQGLAVSIGSLGVSLQVLTAWTANGEGIIVAITGIGVAFSTWNVPELLTNVQSLANTLVTLGAALQAIATADLPNLSVASSDSLTGIQGFAAGLWDAINAGVGFLSSLLSIAGALGIDTAAWAASTAAKVADKAETLALMGMYAKDMIVGLANSTAGLAKNAAAWALTTGAKLWDNIVSAASTVATTAMSVATAAWNVIGGIATGITAAFGVAVQIATSPVTLIILAILALIAIIVLLINYWPQITAAAGAAVEWLKAAWSTVANWFNTNVIQPIAGFFTGLWDSIKKIFTSVGTTIGNAVGGAFKSAVNAVIGFVESTINNLIRGINAAIGIINLIPGVNIRTLSTLSIPRMAQGGVVARPTVAMIGEAGREAVLPLENNTGWMAEMARQLAAAMNGPQLAGGGDILIPVYLDGNLLDQVIVSAQERKNMRSNGR